MIIEGYFSYFSKKPYVMTPHLNCLIETFQMRSRNICFYAELTKHIPNYHHLLPFTPSYLELCSFGIDFFCKGRLLEIISLC